MNGTGGLASRPARVVQAIPKDTQRWASKAELWRRLPGMRRATAAQLCDGSQSRRYGARTSATPSDMVPVTARYDAVADSYAAGADRYDGSAVSTLLDLIGSDVGRRALDLACGHGLLARELARRGATVTGVDLSRELLGRARSHDDGANLPIEYMQGDVADPNVLEGAEFDLVVSNFGSPTSTISRGGVSDSCPRPDRRRTLRLLDLAPMFHWAHPACQGHGQLAAPITTKVGGAPTKPVRARIRSPSISWCSADALRVEQALHDPAVGDADAVRRRRAFWAPFRRAPGRPRRGFGLPSLQRGRPAQTPVQVRRLTYRCGREGPGPQSARGA